MSRTMPTDCPHGGVIDWGDFGDEWSPYHGLCPQCVPMTVEEYRERTVEYRDMNADWLREGRPEDFYATWHYNPGFYDDSEFVPPISQEGTAT